jgi:uncharacterized membrane protein (UPF0127 family)
MKLFYTLCIALIPQLIFCDSYLKVRLFTTEDERTFGLMNVRKLEENEGALFVYEKEAFLSLWMFNCFIDLSIAFVDENYTIQDIKTMKAYPEMMDKKRPVLIVEDLKRYSSNEPIVLFFHNKSIKSAKPAKYAIETNKDWFQKNNIKSGHKIELKEDVIRFYY